MGRNVIVPTSVPARETVAAENLARYGDALIDKVADTGGTIVGASVKGGGIIVTTDGDDNDEAYFADKGKPLALASGEKVTVHAVFTPTEGNTDDQNFIFGLSSVFAADLLQDDGAGPPASYDGVVVFKVDGGTVFQAEYSDATTQETASNIAAWASATEYTVTIEVDCGRDIKDADITITINGVVAQQWLNADLSGLAAAMTIVGGLKAGGANAETATFRVFAPAMG